MAMISTETKSTVMPVATLVHILQSEIAALAATALFQEALAQAGDTSTSEARAATDTAQRMRVRIAGIVPIAHRAGVAQYLTIPLDPNQRHR